MAEQNFTTEELQSEEWRPVVGYESRYSVSSLGRVRSEYDSVRPQRGALIRSLRLDDSGYHRLNLSSGSRSSPRAVRVHLLVALAFLGPRPPGLVINHKDGNKLNNRPSNLEYVTNSENVKHAIATGLMVMPRPHRETRSHERAVIIRRLREQGVSKIIIAHAFQLSLAQISKLSRAK